MGTSSLGEKEPGRGDFPEGKGEDIAAPREGVASPLTPEPDTGEALLPHIVSPADVRALPEWELPRLAREIRERMIAVVARTGGHLAPSLGVVELTIALCRVFDLPQDKVVWDVGHQTYAWKMLTGRDARMGTLRRFGGLRGFTSPDESPYDASVAGHAGVALSTALGFAAARDARGGHEHVVAVVGDASLTNGISLEAVNAVRHTTERLILVINDNGMSISRNVGAFARHFARRLAGLRYNRIRAAAEAAGHRLRLSRAKAFYRRLKGALKPLLLRQRSAVFEELGFRYIGPIDGHDIPALCDALRAAAEGHVPVALHIATVKGKGYAPAERNPSKWHGVAPWRRAEPDTTGGLEGWRNGGSAGSWRTSEVPSADLPMAVPQERSRSPEVLKPKGLKVTGSSAFPEKGIAIGDARVQGQCFVPSTPSHSHVSTLPLKGACPIPPSPPTSPSSSSSPLTYSSVFGAALCALAERDARVVAVTAAMRDGTGLADFFRRFPGRAYDVGICEEHAVAFAAGLAAAGLRPYVALYSTFAQRAVDCVMHDVCLPRLPVTLCLDRAGCVGADGPTHHGLYDIAMLRALPGLTFRAPLGRKGLETALSEALTSGMPTVVRYPRGGVPEAELSPATDVPEGDGPVFLACGHAATWAVPVAETLGMPLLPVDTLKPLPPVVAALRGRPIVTLEDAAAQGGFGAAVAEIHGGPHLILGWPDLFVPQGSDAELRTLCGLDAPALIRRIRAWQGAIDG